MTKGTTKKKWVKIETLSEMGINVYQSTIDRTLFEVSWIKSDQPKRYGRRRYNAASLRDAIDKAPAIAGFAAKQTQTVFTFADAFNETLASSKRKSGTRAYDDWTRDVSRFLIWLEKKHPACRYWHFLTREIVKEYLAKYDGRSDNHRRLRLQPIIQTDKHMAREYQFSRIAEGLNIGNKLSRETPAVYIRDVVDFLDWLREHCPRLEASVALQGLCGLAFLEVLRLTWDKINLQHGLVEISGTVKNDHRARVIPIAGRALDALTHLRETCNVESMHGPDYLALTRTGVPFINTPENYGKEVGKLIRKWNSALGWTCKDLRNAVPTFCEYQGLGGDLLERYIGHKVQSVTGLHYTPSLSTVSKGQREQLGRVMAMLKKHIVDPINAEVEGKFESDILNIFEQAVS